MDSSKSDEAIDAARVINHEVAQPLNPPVDPAANAAGEGMGTVKVDGMEGVEGVKGEGEGAKEDGAVVKNGEGGEEAVEEEEEERDDGMEEMDEEDIVGGEYPDAAMGWYRFTGDNTDHLMVQLMRIFGVSDLGDYMVRETVEEVAYAKKKGGTALLHIYGEIDGRLVAVTIGLGPAHLEVLSATYVEIRKGFIYVRTTHRDRESVGEWSKKAEVKEIFDDDNEFAVRLLTMSRTLPSIVSSTVSLTTASNACRVPREGMTAAEALEKEQKRVEERGVRVKAPASHYGPPGTQPHWDEDAADAQFGLLKDDLGEVDVEVAATLPFPPPPERTPVKIERRSAPVKTPVTAAYARRRASTPVTMDDEEEDSTLYRTALEQPEEEEPAAAAATPRPLDPKEANEDEDPSDEDEKLARLRRAVGDDEEIPPPVESPHGDLRRARRRAHPDDDEEDKDLGRCPHKKAKCAEVRAAARRVIASNEDLDVRVKLLMSEREGFIERVGREALGLGVPLLDDDEQEGVNDNDDADMGDVVPPASPRALPPPAAAAPVAAAAAPVAAAAAPVAAAAAPAAAAAAPARLVHVRRCKRKLGEFRGDGKKMNRKLWKAGAGDRELTKLWMSISAKMRLRHELVEDVVEVALPRLNDAALSDPRAAPLIKRFRKETKDVLEGYEKMKEQAEDFASQIAAIHAAIRFPRRVRKIPCSPAMRRAADTFSTLAAGHLLRARAWEQLAKMLPIV